MVNKVLSDYVEKELKAGFSPEQIKGALLESGCKENEVDSILKEMVKQGVTSEPHLKTALRNGHEKLKDMMFELTHYRFSEIGVAVIFIFVVLFFLKIDMGWIIINLVTLMLSAITISFALYKSMAKKELTINALMKFMIMFCLVLFVLRIIFPNRIVFLSSIPIFFLFVYLVEHFFSLNFKEAIKTGLISLLTGALTSYIVLSITGFLESIPWIV